MSATTQIEQSIATHGDVYAARLIGIIAPTANSRTLLAAMQQFAPLIREAIRYGIEEVLESLAFTEAADPPPDRRGPCRCGARGPAVS